MSVEPIGRAAAPRLRLGRYEVLSKLASGAMGVVYLGRLQGVGGFERLFAIKVLHQHLANKPHIVAMLLNEARLAARIQHPNVVSVVDAELSDSGQYYVVMEYVDGFTLCELLDHPRLDAVRRVRLGLRALLDAAYGLDAAHRLRNPSDGTPAGIVHRDVSPNNILISVQGLGLIADFGIARAVASSTDSLPGVIKGTPCYMAPEQISGAEDLDARADIWGLGAVLWEVLTGEQLFYSPAGVGGVLSLVMTGEIPAPSTRNSRIPPALDAVCLRALARNRAARYATAFDLAEDLERLGREYDLVASAHEAAEAIAALFAERLEHRRALLPEAQPDRSEVSGLVPSSASVPAFATGTGSVPAVAVGTGLGLESGIELGTPAGAGGVTSEAPALPMRKAPWWLVVACGIAVLAAVAAAWIGGSGSGPQLHAEPKQPARENRVIVPDLPSAEPEPVHELLEPAAEPEPAHELLEPAAEPEPRKARAAARTRAPRRSSARAAVPARTPQANQVAAESRERREVLEPNPYLMQR